MIQWHKENINVLNLMIVKMKEAVKMIVVSVEEPLKKKVMKA